MPIAYDKNDNQYHLMEPNGGGACHGARASWELAHTTNVFDNCYHIEILSGSSDLYGAATVLILAIYEYSPLVSVFLSDYNIICIQQTG